MVRRWLLFAGSGGVELLFDIGLNCSSNTQTKHMPISFLACLSSLMRRALFNSISGSLVPSADPWKTFLCCNQDGQVGLQLWGHHISNSKGGRLCMVTARLVIIEMQTVGAREARGAQSARGREGWEARRRGAGAGASWGMTRRGGVHRDAFRALVGRTSAE
ncbi:hypothetical protein GUJ93_ZPchr0013g36307 [Zizania palustris]|uniref:Uncharacterized protein n=1 Tax=Zizania palustris TaxID=103762 RepID=A0A8J5WRI7_ZIZPA|nr:hypothetical protein GUJ93_ZPchr0013g36307 [Zizania palustris]